MQSVVFKANRDELRRLWISVLVYMTVYRETWIWTNPFIWLDHRHIDRPKL